MVVKLSSSLFEACLTELRKCIVWLSWLLKIIRHSLVSTKLRRSAGFQEAGDDIERMCM